MLLSRSQLVVATATTLIKYSSTVAHFTKAPEQEAGGEMGKATRSHWVAVLCSSTL